MSQSLEELYLKLINQLDQKVGREKEILRKYIASLRKRLGNEAKREDHSSS